MVNAGVVNGGPSCFLCVAFCVFFAALGRFPRSQNPVKYAGKLRVNHNMERLGWAATGPWRVNPACFQWDIRP